MRGRSPAAPDVDVPLPESLLVPPSFVTVPASIVTATVCVCGSPFGSVPVRTIWCSPVSVSAGMTTVVLTAPLLSASTLPKNTGSECNSMSTFEAGAQPSSVIVTEPPGATVSALRFGTGTDVVVVVEPGWGFVVDVVDVDGDEEVDVVVGAAVVDDVDVDDVVVGGGTVVLVDVVVVVVGDVEVVVVVVVDDDEVVVVVVDDDEVVVVVDGDVEVVVVVDGEVEVVVVVVDGAVVVVVVLVDVVVVPAVVVVVVVPPGVIGVSVLPASWL